VKLIKSKYNQSLDGTRSNLKDEKTMSQYYWNPLEYKKYSNSQQKWAQELIDKLKLKGNEHILDIGCGDGKVTAEIARRVPEGSVVGVDNAPPMIALAQKHYPTTKYSNLSFKIMDAARLSFREQFDIVFSNAVLHWVRDHTPVIAGIFNALRPGGKMLLQMGGKGNADAILSVLDELRLTQTWHDYFVDFKFPYAFLGTEDYTRMLAEYGFTNTRVELIPKDMQHVGASGLAGWVRTTWLPYTERIPEGKREVFINALVTAYLKKAPMDAAGKAHVAMMRLEVEAEKK
jgi:trans-aconitate 2-methyltransferase